MKDIDVDRLRALLRLEEALCVAIMRNEPSPLDEYVIIADPAIPTSGDACCTVWIWRQKVARE